MQGCTTRALQAQARARRACAKASACAHHVGPVHTRFRQLCPRGGTSTPRLRRLTGPARTPRVPLAGCGQPCVCAYPRLEAWLLHTCVGEHGSKTVAPRACRRKFQLPASEAGGRVSLSTLCFRSSSRGGSELVEARASRTAAACRFFGASLAQCTPLVGI